MGVSITNDLLSEVDHHYKESPTAIIFKCTQELYEWLNLSGPDANMCLDPYRFGRFIGLQQVVEYNLKERMR